MRYVPSLGRAEIEEATRQTYALWGSGRAQADHTAHVFEQLDRAGPELLRYVGLVGEGGLGASIKRYGMLLGHGGHTLRAVGIGAVFTNPAARGKGLAQVLLREVMAEARDLGYAAAFLYSDIDPAYYARLGFVALPAVDHVALPAELPAGGALAVRPATAADLDRLLAWYEESWTAAPEVLRLARSRALWRFFHWRNLIHGEWILSDGGRDVGYLVAAPDEPLRDLPEPRPEGLFWLDEWSAPGIPAERILATVRALAERHACKLVGTWPRPGQAPGPFRAVPRPSAFPMIAPLAPGLAVDPARSYLSSFEHF